jgi:RecG-like helicase
MELSSLRGVSETRAKDFAKMGIFSVEDLPKYFPKNHLDLTTRQSLREAYHNDFVLTAGELVAQPRMFRKGKMTVVQASARQGDDYFRIVMAMMEVLLCHSLTLSTSLRAEPSSPGVMRSYFQVRKALEKLPSEFRYHELIEALCSEGLSQSSAKRTRQRLLDRQVIVHEGETYRFMNRLWRSRLKG